MRSQVFDGSQGVGSLFVVEVFDEEFELKAEHE